MNIGDMYYYKTSKTRGRPYVGTVTRKLGFMVELRNKHNGQLMCVNTKYVGRPYEFKPYNKNKVA